MLSYNLEQDLSSFVKQRSRERREVLFEDRTKCHADHVGHGLDRKTTAAVAILKAVEMDQSKLVNV